MEPVVFIMIDSAITNEKELLESCLFFFFMLANLFSKFASVINSTHKDREGKILWKKHHCH